MRPLALLAMGAGAASTSADPDLWGHVRFGLDMLRDRALHAADPYSYTSDRPWINHEWLSELLSGVAYQFAGTRGLIALKVLVGVALFSLVWNAVRERDFTWRWSGMAIAAFAAIPVLWTVRPQLWTAIAIVIICRILTASSSRPLWLLPPLFAVWANLHGGWLVGGALVAGWTAVAVVRRDRRALPLLAAGLCSLLATLVTPYGLELWRFLGETVRFGRADISEWQPMWRVGLVSVVLWAATVGLIAVSWWRAGRPPTETIVLLSAFAVAAARVNRLGPLFGLATVTLLARTWPKAARDIPVLPGRTAIDVLAVAVGLSAIFLIQERTPGCIMIDPRKGPDTVAAEPLRGRSGTLVTSFNWGEYAIWHFGPALKVSMDGRRETVYSMPTLNTQIGVHEGTADGLAELARARPDYVWLPITSERTREWLRTHGYREDVRTPRSFVAARAELPPLAAWDGIASRCFPGP